MDGYTLVVLLTWLAILGLAMCNMVYLGYHHWYIPRQTARRRSPRTQDFANDRRQEQDLEQQQQPPPQRQDQHPQNQQESISVPLHTYPAIWIAA
ncbi:hypothetical protein PG995_014380 [Apiospora arundinis]